MGGGEFQLKTGYGAESIYLIGNPSMTYFRLVARRHTNFAMEYIKNYFVNVPVLNTTGFTKLTAEIDRNGDLMADTYFVIDMPDIYSRPVDNFKWVDNLGEQLIRSVEIFIGGMSIDKHYGQWMQIWTDISYSDTKKKSYERMVEGDETPPHINGTPELYYGTHGDVDGLLSNAQGFISNPPTIKRKRIYVPLLFWFCINPGLAIPLISLQYTPVQIEFELNPLNNLFTIGEDNLSPATFFQTLNNSSPTQCSEVDPVKLEHFNEIVAHDPSPFDVSNIFWKYVNGTNAAGHWNQNIYLDINYIFLDTDERTRFAYSTNEYLIPQLQRYDTTGLRLRQTLEIKFHHPVNELMWIFQRDDVGCHNDWLNFTNARYSKDWDEVFKRVQFAKQLYATSAGSQIGTPLSPTAPDLYTFLKEYTMPSILPSGTSVQDFIYDAYSNDMNFSFDKYIDSFDTLENIMYEMTIKFNGQDRNQVRDQFFYDTLESFRFHTNTKKGIYKYSFALNPEELATSGHVNLSTINKMELEFLLRDPPYVQQCEQEINQNCNNLCKGGSNALIYPRYNYNMFLYAKGYNILRIMNGIGGIVFS